MKRSAIYIGVLLAICQLVPVGMSAEQRCDANMTEGKSVETVQHSVYQGFSGGMMVHLGYLYGSNDKAPVTMNGGTMGIGGAARVHLWNHLRIGGEGFVSTLPAWMSSVQTPSQAPDMPANTPHTLQPGSYVRNGWGGILADAYWQCGKVFPFLGATVGGGAQRALYIAEGSQTDWQEEPRVLFHRQTYFMLDPFVGMEIAVSAHMHLTLRADYVLPIQRTGLLAPHGPRIYIGMMFCH